MNRDSQITATPVVEGPRGATLNLDREIPILRSTLRALESARAPTVLAVPYRQLIDAFRRQVDLMVQARAEFAKRTRADGVQLAGQAAGLALVIAARWDELGIVVCGSVAEPTTFAATTTSGAITARLSQICSYQVQAVAENNVDEIVVADKLRAHVMAAPEARGRLESDLLNTAQAISVAASQLQTNRLAGPQQQYLSNLIAALTATASAVRNTPYTLSPSHTVNANALVRALRNPTERAVRAAAQLGADECGRL